MDKRTFRISFPENAATGYKWIIQNNEKDLVDAGITYYKFYTPVEQPYDGELLIGGGGTMSFVFEYSHGPLGDSQNIITIVFMHRQPWVNGKIDTGIDVMLPR